VLFCVRSGSNLFSASGATDLQQLLSTHCDVHRCRCVTFTFDPMTLKIVSNSLSHDEYLCKVLPKSLHWVKRYRVTRIGVDGWTDGRPNSIMPLLPIEQHVQQNKTLWHVSTCKSNYMYVVASQAVKSSRSWISPTAGHPLTLLCVDLRNAKNVSKNFKIICQESLIDLMGSKGGSTPSALFVAP